MAKSEIVVEDKKELSSATPGFIIDPEDIDIPKVNLVQKMSQIDGPLGSIMLDQKHCIAEADVPVGVSIVSARKGWREDIPFDEDEMPRIAWNHDDRDALEAESGYKILEFADIRILFHGGEDADQTVYNVPIGDEQYALGRINVQKDAYRNTYKRLATFAAVNNGADLSSKVWNMKSILLTKGKYSWYCPSLENSPEVASEGVIQFLKMFQ